MADQELGKLVIKIVADITDLKKQFPAAKAEMKDLVDSTKNQFGGLGSAFSQLKQHWVAISAGIASVIAAYKGLESSVSAVATLGQEVAQLQRTTGMTAETASEMIAVAGHMGVSFETISTAVTWVARRMGALKDIESMTVDETGKTVDVFKKFGIEIKDTDGKIRPFADIFHQLRARIREAGSETERMLMATQFFRHGSQELLKLLTLSDEEWRSISEEMKKYGKIIGQDSVDSVMKFVFAKREATAATEGFKIQIGTAMLPALTSFIKGLSDLIVEVKNLKAIFGETGGIIGVALKTALVSLQSLVAGVSAIMMALAEVDLELLRITDVITLGMDSSTKKAIVERMQMMIDLRKSLDAQYEAINETLFGEGPKVKVPQLAPPGKGGLGEMLDAKQVAALDKLQKKLDELVTEMVKLDDPTKAAIMAIDDFIKETTKGVATAPQLTKAIADLRAAAELLEENKIWKETAKATEDAIDSMEDKIRELKGDLLKLIDPIRADQVTFDFFIASLLKGIPLTDEVIDAIKRVRQAYQGLKDTQGKQAIDAAEASRLEMENTQRTQTALAVLETAYERGTVKVEDYYAQKRKIMADSMENSIALLDREKSAVDKWTDSKEKTAKAMEIDTKIRQIQLEAERQGIQLNLEETKAVKDQSAALADWKEKVATLRGDLKGMYDAQIMNLEAQKQASLQMAKDDPERKQMIEDYYNLKEAEIKATRDMDVPGLMSIGNRKALIQANDSLANQFENLLPNSIHVFTDSIRGADQGFKNFFSNVETGLLKMIQNILLTIAEMELLKAIGFEKTSTGTTPTGGGLWGLISSLWGGSPAPLNAPSSINLTGLEFASGGTFLATRPTTIRVGEGGRPEIGMIMPISKMVSPSVFGPPGGFKRLSSMQGFSGGGLIVSAPGGGGEKDHRVRLDVSLDPSLILKSRPTAEETDLTVALKYKAGGHLYKAIKERG